VGSLAERAFRQHYGQVYRYLRRRTASDEQAEDLAQSVFVDAAAGLDRFREGSPPVLAWLYTVAQRRLADAHRRAARGPAEVVPIETALARRALQTEYGADVAAALRRAIGALPEGQREVVVLRLVHGHSFAETAERLESTPAACKMRLVRALETLRDELARAGIEP
jgi:RNA polymerase sigma-70 factor, ECF subfamily